MYVPMKAGWKTPGLSAGVHCQQIPGASAAELCVAPDSLLPANYGEAVHHAFLVPRLGGEEVHVPIPSAQALEILKDEQLRIGSVLVTMDGRWWEAVRLPDRDPHSVGSGFAFRAPIRAFILRK